MGTFRVEILFLFTMVAARKRVGVFLEKGTMVFLSILLDVCV